MIGFFAPLILLVAFALLVVLYGYTHTEKP